MNSHWRTSSGGSSIPAVVPSQNDNVFFDANSGIVAGTVITVDVVANANNFTFSGINVNFAIGGGGYVNAFGNVTLVSGLTYQNTLILAGSANTSITTNGATFIGTLQIAGSASTVKKSLSDDFNSARNGTIDMVGGELVSNNYTLNLNYFINENSSITKTLTLGTSVLNVNNYLAMGIITNAGSSIINSYGQYFDYNANGGTGFNIVNLLGNIYRSLSGGSTFNELNSEGSLFIGGRYLNNTFGKINFTGTGNKTFIICQQTVQTITNSLNLSSPACSAFSVIQSGDVNLSSTIKLTSGAVLNIQNTAISGIAVVNESNDPANVTVSNCYDIGNNSGIVFTTSSVRDLYWVGGSGNWSDGGHWSDTDGGTAINCIPTPNDNVFFNDNSATANYTVTVDSESYANDMKFVGNSIKPTLSSASVGLNIFGSIVWQSDMTVNITSLLLQNTKTASITSNGAQLAIGTITKTKSGTTDIEDDFYSTGNFVHAGYNGTFNTNNHKINFNFMTLSLWNVPAKVNFGSSEIYVVGGIGTTSFCTLDAGTSHVYITGNSGGISEAYGNKNYYDITFVNPAGSYFIDGGNYGSISAHNVVCNGDFRLGGTYSTFNSLTLSPLNAHFIRAGFTVNITSALSLITPDCNGFTTLSSEDSGNPSTIAMGSGATVDVSGTVLTGIKITGATPYLAQNSVDGGNNSGWTFTTGDSKDLYWIGGTGNWNDKAHWALSSGGVGGTCVPGSSDNVFFDAGSGFTTNSKTVTVDAASFAHNVTVDGSSVPPTIGESNFSLNISGNSIWQANMSLTVGQLVFLPASGTTSTIKTNGVLMSWGGILYDTRGIYFGGLGNIELLDNFTTGANVRLNAGNLDTNGYTFDIPNFTAGGSTPINIKLGNSMVYVNKEFGLGNDVTLDAGTSQIHFNKDWPGFIYGPNNTTFYDLYFETTNNDQGQILGNNTLNFHNVTAKKNALFANNSSANFTYNQLILYPNRTYVFNAGSTHNITEKLYASGNNCQIIYLTSSSVDNTAKINVEAGLTDFDFANVAYLESTGTNQLHFGSKSTDAGGNVNIAFDTYNSGTFTGFVKDWSCVTIDESDPTTYIVDTDNFYGTPETTYSWIKLNDPDYTGVISTDSDLNILTFGYGTYQVTVNYGVDNIPCVFVDQVTVKQQTAVPTVTTNADGNYVICEESNQTLADITVDATGDVQWYETYSSTTVLDPTTVLEGTTYYVTQTVDGCESKRVAVKVTIKPCINGVISNPGMRMRVSQ